MANELFYGWNSYELAHGVGIPAGTDVGWLFLQYHKATTETELTRTRLFMITNGDGTFDAAQGVYHEDGTYTDTFLEEGVAGGFWGGYFKEVSSQCYVVLGTRAEFDEFVTALGL